MDSAVGISLYRGGMDDLPEINVEQRSMNHKPVKKRGRPKGAVSASISEVRKQAAEEKRQLRQEFVEKIDALQAEVGEWRRRYDADIAALNQEIDVLRRREGCYQQALGERLEEVAARVQDTLLNWANAELEEAQIDKRRRGRPRKTIK